MALTAAQIQAHIDWLETLIPQLRTSIFGLSLGTMKNYIINDGQTVQSVTKKDLPNLKAMLDNALSDLGKYQAETSSGGGCYLRSAS